MGLGFSVGGTTTAPEQKHTSTPASEPTVEAKSTPDAAAPAEVSASGEEATSTFSIAKTPEPLAPVEKKPATKAKSGAGFSQASKKTTDPVKSSFSLNINPQTFMITKFFVTLIFLCIGFVFYSSNWYVGQYLDAGQNLPQDPNIMTYEEYEKKVSDLLFLYNQEAYTSLSTKGKAAKNTIRQVMSANDITYIHKLKVFHTAYANIVKEFTNTYAAIDKTKADITQHGFFAEELETLMETKNNQISLQRSLLSLEVIRFTTAMKVFGLLQTFLEQFGRSYRIDEPLLAKKMEEFSKRAELDIERYIQSCYLNPFENLKTCKFIGDFDKYYTLFEPNSDFNTNLFKELMAFIDEKLSSTSFPSLAITFDRFNPQSSSVNFKITVNTMQDDELELINQGIISPHIFVVINVINLLKQSNFILGEGINVNTMEIQTNEVDIGGKTLVVHSSERAFSVPLQQQVQREIFDYTPDVSIYEGSVVEDTAKTDLETYGIDNE